jgi:hypothetical protein
VAMGTVKWFEPIKGYGFITPDDRGPMYSIPNWSGERASATKWSLPEKFRRRICVSIEGGGSAVILSALESI